VRSDNIVIADFVFRRVRNTYQNAMVTLNGEGIEFRDNLLEYSSAGSGLAIQTRHSHIHDNILRHNGQFGFSVGGGENLVENNLVQGNDLAGYKEWGTGGTKIVGSGNIIRRNRFVDNLGGVGIQLATYNRKATDLAKWQERHANEKHKQWLHRSWEGGVVYAYSNMFFNYIVVQSASEATGPCVFLMGLTNSQKPHCFGNLFDYNFYWNSVTHTPKVHVKNLSEVPNASSEWQTRYGMDTHAFGGFTQEDYRQPAFGAEYPYKPTASFVGIGKGRATKDLSWNATVDYLDSPLVAERKPSMGHIESIRR